MLHFFVPLTSAAIILFRDNLFPSSVENNGSGGSELRQFDAYYCIFVCAILSSINVPLFLDNISYLILEEPKDIQTEMLMKNIEQKFPNMKCTHLHVFKRWPEDGGFEMLLNVSIRFQQRRMCVVGKEVCWKNRTNSSVAMAEKNISGGTPKLLSSVIMSQSQKVSKEEEGQEKEDTRLLVEVLSELRVYLLEQFGIRYATIEPEVLFIPLPAPAMMKSDEDDCHASSSENGENYCWNGRSAGCEQQQAELVPSSPSPSTTSNIIQTSQVPLYQRLCVENKCSEAKLCCPMA